MPGGQERWAGGEKASAFEGANWLVVAEAESEAVGRASPRPPHTHIPVSHDFVLRQMGSHQRGFNKGLMWPELYFQKILFLFKKVWKESECS